MCIKMPSPPLRRSCSSDDHMAPDGCSHRNGLCSLEASRQVDGCAHPPQTPRQREPCAQVLQYAAFDGIAYRQSWTSPHVYLVCWAHSQSKIWRNPRFLAQNRLVTTFQRYSKIRGRSERTVVDTVMNCQISWGQIMCETTYLSQRGFQMLVFGAPGISYSFHVYAHIMNAAKNTIYKTSARMSE